jgi:hypothetical protein
LTVEPASAVSVISGKLSLPGEAGAVARDDGAAGAVESSTYATPDEQPEAFPAASVAVAKNVRDESSGTATAIPGEANVAAVPEAATALVHEELV